jgi:hypothetical protein
MYGCSRNLTWDSRISARSIDRIQHTTLSVLVASGFLCTGNYSSYTSTVNVYKAVFLL